MNEMRIENERCNNSPPMELKRNRNNKKVYQVMQKSRPDYPTENSIHIDCLVNGCNGKEICAICLPKLDKILSNIPDGEEIARFYKAMKTNRSLIKLATLVALIGGIALLVAITLATYDCKNLFCKEITLFN